MRFIFGLIFAPWWVLIILAVLTFGAGTWSYQSIQRFEANKAEALAGPIPDPVDLADFDRKIDVTKAYEVNLALQINTKHNFTLTQTSRKRADVVRRLYVLFDRNDAGNAKIARAAILLLPSEVDRFVEFLQTSISGVGTYSAVFNVNGKFSKSAALDTMAEEAITEKLGLTLSENFGYISPFLNGREKAFAPRPDAARDTLAVFAGIGLLLLMVGMVKFFRTRSRPKVVGAANETAPVKAMPFARMETTTTPEPAVVQPRKFPVKSAMFALFLLVVLIRPNAVMTLLPLMVVVGVLVVTYGGPKKTRALGNALLHRFGITQEGKCAQYIPKEMPISSHADTVPKPQRKSVLQRDNSAKRRSPKSKSQTGFSNGPVQRIAREGLLSWLQPKPKSNAFDRLKQM